MRRFATWRARLTLRPACCAGYFGYLAIQVILQFKDDTDDPPLQTNQYTPKYLSGLPNFPPLVVCHPVFNRSLDLVQMTYSTRGNASSAATCQRLDNHSTSCEPEFPYDRVEVWRIVVAEPSLAHGRRRQLSSMQSQAQEAGEEGLSERRRLSVPTSSPASPSASPTSSPVGPSSSPTSSPVGPSSSPTSSPVGPSASPSSSPSSSPAILSPSVAPHIASPTAQPTAYDPYSAGYVGGYGSLPPGFDTGPYDPYADAAPLELPPGYNEYEQPAANATIKPGLNCIAFNLTTLAGFTYKRRKVRGWLCRPRQLTAPRRTIVGRAQGAEHFVRNGVGFRGECSRRLSRANADVRARTWKRRSRTRSSTLGSRAWTCTFIQRPR
jgi:hypothetical protein